MSDKIRVHWKEECASCGDIIEDSPQPYCKTCWKDFYEKKEREQ